MKRCYYYSRCHYDMKVVLSHEEESIDLIIDLVKRENPQMIVELGTAYYGLTLLLHECNRKTPLFTFDRYDARLYLGRTKGMTNKAELEHVFRKGFTGWVTFVNADVIWRKNIFLTALLNIPRKKLLYCDNGKKVREVIYYAPELNTGDILGIHDWGTEVNPEKIEKPLLDYEPHPINELFETKSLTSRFFIKK